MPKQNPSTSDARQNSLIGRQHTIALVLANREFKRNHTKIEKIFVAENRNVAKYEKKMKAI